MRIQRLFLRNVRNIKSLDLDFRDPITGKPMSRIVLAGANGSGKTTILECIFGLFSTTGQFITGDALFHGKLQDIEIALFSHSHLQLLFDIEQFTLSAYYGPTEDHLVKDQSISAYAWVGGRPKGPGAVLGLDDSSPYGRLSRSIQAANERIEDALGSILYFPHNRFLPSVPQGELGVEAKTYQWAYRYQSSAEWKGSIESYLFSLNYLDLEDRDRKIPAKRFGEAVKLVNSVLSGKRIARIEKGRVVVETEKSETHGLDDLSSGEKQLVLLLIEILRRIVPGSVILIDEPEISLHPAWQRGLMAALDKIVEQYDAQVIVATHSLDIASMVLPYEVISLNDLGLPLGKWEPEKEALA